MSTSDIIINGVLLGVLELSAYMGYKFVHQQRPIGWVMVLIRSVFRLYVVVAIGYYAMVIPLIAVDILIEGQFFSKWWKDYRDPSPF